MNNASIRSSRVASAVIKGDNSVDEPVEGENYIEGTALRAKERVRQYLMSQFEKIKLSSGSRLPTSRTLAKHLDVSVSTVQTVFRELAADGLIRTEVGNGSFLIRSPNELPQSALKIGISFGFANNALKTEPWHLSICGAILSSASGMSPSAAIIPVQFNPAQDKSVVEFLEDISRQVDGIILRPVGNWSQVEAKLSNPRFPIVHLNPTEPMSTRDFVSADFFQAGHRVGTAFGASKRKRVVFLHAVPAPLSVSSTLRYAGMVAALGNSVGHGIAISVDIATELSHAGGIEVAKKLFANKATAPDAIYTISDDLAAGVLTYCLEKGIDVPSDLSVVVAGGVDIYSDSFHDFTREHHDVNQMGAALLEMVMARVQENGRSQPAIYVPTSFLGGKTTLPEENKVLQLSVPLR